MAEPKNPVAPVINVVIYKEGGSNGSPKFPMPNSYNFLLKYGHLTNNTEALEHVEITLDKMYLTRNVPK